MSFCLVVFAISRTSFSAFAVFVSPVLAMTSCYCASRPSNARRMWIKWLAEALFGDHSDATRILEEVKWEELDLKTRLARQGGQGAIKTTSEEISSAMLQLTGF